MNPETKTPIEVPKHTGRRGQRRMVQVLAHGIAKRGEKYAFPSGAAYRVLPSGTFVRTNKDRRSKKQRRAERQAARTQAQ